MIRRILVPLDGTDLAEAALPAAAALCAKLGAAVVLVHLLEKRAPRAVHGRPHLATAGEAEAYLNEVAARRFPTQLKVEVHVHSEGVVDVARSITAHAEHPQEAGSELIVMCAHGGRTTREALVGALAQRVTARGRTPVLVVRASAPGGAPGGRGAPPASASPRCSCRWTATQDTRARWSRPRSWPRLSARPCTCC